MNQQDASGGAGGSQDKTRNDQEHELEAEQESAEAMDAEVLHGDASQQAEAAETTEGQPT